MDTGTVAAISRQLSTLAVRCADGQYSLIRFADDWLPAVGERMSGELRQRGAREVRVGDGSTRLVEVESFNCSVQFARDRLKP